MLTRKEKSRKKCPFCGDPAKRKTCEKPECMKKNANSISYKHFDRFRRKTSRKIIACAGAA